MAKYGPQTWTDGVSALSAARMAVIENGIREASMGRSTTFPSSPVDGDIHVYPADTTNGVMWMFMWRAAVSDWEFIGGRPLYAEVVTVETTTSTTYVALATAGPSIALPFIGDYDVELGGRIWNTTDAMTVFMSYDIGGTAAVDADGMSVWTGATASGGDTMAVSQQRMRRKAGLTAVTLTAKYKTSGGTAKFQNRWMAVTPVRHTP